MRSFYGPNPSSVSLGERMLEVRGRLDFRQESFGTDHGGRFWFENLQRDLSLMF